MSNLDKYPTYIKIVDDDESDDIMELPTEKDGTILLSTILAQYPTATGLRFKTDTGSWEEIQLAESILYPPGEGWGEKEYFVTFLKQESVKRKNTSSHNNGPDAKVVCKTTEEELLSDLIVLGLTYSATEEEFKNYFETFGELAMHEIKRNPNTQKSKGFGFIRYTSAEVAQKVLDMEHTVGGRRCEVRLPKKQEDLPTKLFVGRLKEGTTAEELREHFSAYGDLRDVYVPKNFRGFGFITLNSQEAACSVIEATHIIKGSCVNVLFAETKGEKRKQGQMDANTQYGGQQSTQGYNTQGNYTQGYNTQGNNTQGNNTQGYNTQGYNAQGNNTQGNNTQGNNTQGNNTQGNNTQGNNTQGNNTQGYYTQGYNTQGHGAQGNGAQGNGTQGYSSEQYRPSSFSRVV